MTRRGSTLVELIVVLAVMGIVASVVTFAMRPARPKGVDAKTELATARQRAIQLRRPVTAAVNMADSVAHATFLADGSVVADSSLRLDALTGAMHDAR